MNGASRNPNMPLGYVVRYSDIVLEIYLLRPPSEACAFVSRLLFESDLTILRNNSRRSGPRRAISGVGTSSELEDVLPQS
jgi:hypothetical protein